MQIQVTGDIAQEQVDKIVAQEVESFRKQGKNVARITLTVDGDEIEVRTIEKSPIRRVRRITGYLAEVDNWNSAKKAELRDRVVHLNLSKSLDAFKETGITLRVDGLYYESVVDGPGLRDVLFVQGCPHRCPGCHNPGSWDFSGGTEVDVAEVKAAIPSSPIIRGVTFSGGEPFCQAAPLVEIARHIKNLGLDLWVYTGYTWEELINNPNPEVRELLTLTDVVVDGRFVQAQADKSLPFRGSANQRIIDVQRTLKKGRVVLWELPRACAGLSLPEPYVRLHQGKELQGSAEKKRAG